MLPIIKGTRVLVSNQEFKVYKTTSTQIFLRSMEHRKELVYTLVEFKRLVSTGEVNVLDTWIPSH